MKTNIALLIFATLSSSTVSHAGFSIAKTGGPARVVNERACFEDRLAFFRNYQRMNVSRSAKIEALDTACAEFGRDEIMRGKTIADRALNVFGNASMGIMFGGGVSAFQTPNATPTQRRYVVELDRIRNIRDPMERIRQVYELASRHSGNYDYETNGLRTWRDGLLVTAETPGNLINAAERRGTIGVCREYASLLQWSLIQVQRHPSSTRMDLGPTDFSSEMITGNVGGGHAWVRVNLPVHDAQGRITNFTRFDLDTTWYPRFTPVFPRRSGLSAENRQRAVRECREIRNCLQNPPTSTVSNSTVRPTPPPRRTVPNTRSGGSR